jgi:predicted dehydrogenase
MAVEPGRGQATNRRNISDGKGYPPLPVSEGVLRVGIAGFGMVGNVRRRVVDTHPNMQVVAVCDQIFSEPQLSEPDGLRCWTTFEQLLEESLDVLFVSLPNYLAAEVAIAGLDRGLHVFCEKPPGRDVSDIERVRDAEAKRPGQKLMYGFNHRYHHSVQEALRVIRSGELGKVLDLRGIYGKSKMIPFGEDVGWRGQRALAGGGILLDQGIHMVDMMRLFAGEFTHVDSVVSNAYWGHDVEDNAYALMRTNDGVVALLQSSATQWRHRFSLDVTLERGAIALSGILSSTKSYGAETITVVYRGENDAGDPQEQTTRYNEDNSWQDEVNTFAAAILSDTPIVEGSSLEALQTMELVYRIYCADKAWATRWNLDAPGNP